MDRKMRKFETKKTVNYRITKEITKQQRFKGE